MTEHVTILAIDPATITGWAMLRDGQVWSGLIYANRLSTTDGPGMQLLRFEKQLMQTFGDESIHTLVLERPFFFQALEPTVIVGGLYMHALAWARRNGIHVMNYSPATIKKHATDNGQATKELMLSSARKRWPDVEIRDHNQADALWLLDLAING